MFTVHGTKDNPTTLHFQAHDENGELYDKVRTTLFNPQRLTDVDSNCTTRTQKFYKWQKVGFKPLYIHQDANGGKYGSFYDINVYEDPNQMVEALNEIVSNSTFYDDSGNRVDVCIMMTLEIELIYALFTIKFYLS